ncbi:MAG TPA: T9SS type A sorting domain-containing protein [Chitinophagales bacterium]|nr:T9SS type A sorting domain-containing protein [Chitinophagales bacterium]HRK26245.1 T9SS type A sorting domain-containing protein [Chitinophagales bacterium]
MQKSYFYYACLLFLNLAASAQQGTFDRIITQVFNAQCNNAGCHAAASAAGGLSLEGTPAQIRAALYDVNATNAVSQAANNKRVFPGHPYRSKLFMLVNNGLSPHETLLPEEDPGNIHAGINISNLHKELIRQWILFNCPTTGQAVSHSMLEEFYSGNGIWATDPANPPAKPAPGEGFQIHLGPIFLPPWQGAAQPDEEYHYKYATLLPQNIEIHRLEGNIGSSHHMIMFRYNNTNNANSIPWGLQQNEMGGGRSMIAAFGQSATVSLPQGTAFRWYANSFLDLNTHVVNYSTTAVLATDVYVNVYTQPFNTAAQEMKTTLLINPALFIPYGAGLQTFTADIRNNASLPSTYYVWQMSSHTHRFGQSFNVWRRNTDGTKGEHLYNANKYNGIPECEEIGYDYQHPPNRIFDGYLQVQNSVGMIQEATYLNNEIQPFITWGNTVNDEMMITGIFYLESLNGVTLPDGSVCFAEEIATVLPQPNTYNPTEAFSVNIVPNPAAQQATLSIGTKKPVQDATFTLYNLMGEAVLQISALNLDAGSAPQEFPLHLSGLARGMYLYLLSSNNGSFTTGKLMVK